MLTIILRFCFRLESNRHTRSFGKISGGIRIHHGYVGILFILLGLVTFGFRSILFILGLGLLLSEFFHHVVVLWLLTGKHEFSLRYPRKG